MASTVSPFPNRIADQPEVATAAEVAPTRAPDAATPNQQPALAGTLDQMPLPDLLQTSSTNGRTGRIDLEGGPTVGDSGTGRIWMRDGRVVDAAVRDESAAGGELAGREALYRLLTWTEGRFALIRTDVDTPDRLQDSTSYLLLDAMREIDESRRFESPGHAGLPEEPPEPSRGEQALHLSLLLLNVTSTWVGSQLRPELIVERFEEVRAALQSGHPQLLRFDFDHESALVGLASEAETVDEEDVDAIVAAVGVWLRGFYRRMERSLPGRFFLERLAELTGAHAEQLTDLGFHKALGWPDHWPEDDTTTLTVTPETPSAS